MPETYCPGYLYYCLGSLLLACALLALLPRHRRLMLYSGLLSAPLGFCSYWFVPEYWQPQRLMVFVAGLEDLCFSFANGVIVVGLAAWALPAGRERVERLGPGLMRFLLLCLACCPLGLGLMALGVGAMRATVLLGLLVWLASALYCQGGALRLSLAGGLGFGIPYCLALRLLLHLYPRMESWWAGHGLAGQWVLGIPLGEMLWALLFGATWPLLMGWTLGWRARPAPRRWARARLGKASPVSGMAWFSD